MQVAVVGAGYVGLVTGVTFAYLGHSVALLDINPDRVDAVNRGEAPIYEAHLDELLKGLVGHSLLATTDPETALSSAEVIFIAVGTPPREDGEADMTAVRQACLTVGRHLSPRHSTVVVTKSTVPIGSANAVRLWIEDGLAERPESDVGPLFAVASNPEFLREGEALRDSFYPDRIVWGADEDWAIDRLRTLYGSIARQDFSPPEGIPRPPGRTSVPVFEADRVSVEMIKYAANAFLATKISFANEMATISELVGADVRQVMDGIGMDTRIGRSFLDAGIGFGGSCFGKDLQALIHTAVEYGYHPRLLGATVEVNQLQRSRVIYKLQRALKTLKGRRVGILGLAFKPGTDDLRDAPSRSIIEALLSREVRVIAYDPVAMDHARAAWADLDVRYANSVAECLQQVDAAVLVTDWPQFAHEDWAGLSRVMARPLIVDGRNQLNPATMRTAGYEYEAIGR